MVGVGGDMGGDGKSPETRLTAVPGVPGVISGFEEGVSAGMVAIDYLFAPSSWCWLAAVVVNTSKKTYVGRVPNYVPNFSSAKIPRAE